MIGAPIDLDHQLDMLHHCKPEPDRDGLFDAAGVVWIAGRRHCTVTVQSELVLTVVAKAAIQLVAIAPGRWDPVATLTACTKAHRRESFEVDIETARIENRGGIDELKIARVVAADGLRPYLSRSGLYRRCDRNVQMPLNRECMRLIRDGWHMEHQYPVANRGEPTWTFFQVINLQTLASNQNHEFRRAVRALSDVGFLSIEPGPRGGMSRATFSWTKRAYLPPQLNLYEHDAIAEIAAGLV